MANRTRSQSSMFVAVPVLLVAGLTSGCGKDTRDRLKGKWTGDRIENVDAEQVARATGWAKGTSLEFSGDKLTVTIPAEAPRTGSYKVAKVDGQKVVLSVNRNDATSDGETTFTMVDEKTLRWDLGQSREVVLLRAQ